MEDSILTKIVKINPKLISDFITYLRDNNYKEVEILSLNNLGVLGYLLTFFETKYHICIIADNYNYGTWIASNECKLTHTGGKLLESSNTNPTNIIQQYNDAFIAISNLTLKPF